MKYRYREQHEMKDSGVEWLGMIPKEWSRSALKYLVKTKITDGPHETPEIKDDGIPFLSAESIVNNKISISNMRGYITKEQYEIYAKKSKVNRNDILFCKSGSTTGKSALVETNEIFGIWSPLAIIRANNKINYRNLFYVIQSNYFRVQVENYWSFGTQPNIGMAVLENLFIPYSKKIEEQQKIADFLDKKCEEFDSVIAKKEMLINKLEEAKKSLISEVVTGKVKVIQKENGEYGIIKREAHEMKDSGVEWLGMIPKEWNRSALKYLVKTRITDGPHETPEIKDDGIPFLSAESIVNNKISVPNMRGYITKEQYEIYAKKSKVYRNDILFCKSGSTTGKSALVETDEIFGIWSPLAIIRANNKINYRNLFYVIQSNYFRVQVENYWSFGTQPNIGMAVLENLFIPYSKKIEEQQKIYSFLDKKSEKFDSVIEKQKQFIEKLKSAKQSLISEAVTGKIQIL